MGCILSLASSEPDAGISNMDGHFSQGFIKGRERELRLWSMYFKFALRIYRLDGCPGRFYLQAVARLPP